MWLLFLSLQLLMVWNFAFNEMGGLTDPPWGRGKENNGQGWYDSSILVSFEENIPVECNSLNLPTLKIDTLNIPGLKHATHQKSPGCSKMFILGSVCVTQFERQISWHLIVCLIEQKNSHLSNLSTGHRLFEFFHSPILKNWSSQINKRCWEGPVGGV